MANDETGSGIVQTNGGVGAGMTRTDGLGSGTMARVAETNAAASAAMARANVEARFVMARANPRDTDEVRVRILKECRRPGFAEIARYSIPRGGKKIEGPSIRLAEVCARHMGNMEISSPVIYEDEEKRIVRCSVTDLESNATYSSDIAIAKVVERRQADPGAVLGARKNSYGDMVYIVRATDDEMLQKSNALISKTIRTLIFRLVPGDILDEAEDCALQTLQSKAKEDPDAARKRLVDSFAAVGVMPGMLKDLIGHDVATTTPAELVELRQVYVALKEGSASWAEIITGKKGAAEAAGDETKPAATRAGAAKAAAAKAAGKARGSAPTHDAVGEVIDPGSGVVAPEDEPPLGEPD